MIVSLVNRALTTFQAQQIELWKGRSISGGLLMTGMLPLEFFAHRENFNGK